MKDKAIKIKWIVTLVDGKGKKHVRYISAYTAFSALRCLEFEDSTKGLIFDKNVQYIQVAQEIPWEVKNEEPVFFK